MIMGMAQGLGLPLVSTTTGGDDLEENAKQ
jgi:hypothetical protein